MTNFSVPSDIDHPEKRPEPDAGTTTVTPRHVVTEMPTTASSPADQQLTNNTSMETVASESIPISTSDIPTTSADRLMRVGCFNLLCDGLSFNEFQCLRGDENHFTKWAVREPKLLQIMSEMFTQGCNLVVTLENDHFHRMLRKLRQEHGQPIRGIQGLNYSDRKPNKHSTAYNVRAKRMLKEAGIPFASGDDYYALCNDAFHRGVFHKAEEDVPSSSGSTGEETHTSYDIARSFHGECGDEEIAKMVAEIYGRTADDFYLSDDSIGVFYNEDLLELLEVTMPWEEHMNGIVSSSSNNQSYANTPIDEGVASLEMSGENVNVNFSDKAKEKDVLHSIVVLNASFCLKCLFRIKATNQLMTVYAAHLKSGEGVGEEMQRYKQLKVILDDTLTLPKDTFPVIVMDSNNSRLYEHEYPTRGTLVRMKTAKLAPEEDVPFLGCESDLMDEYEMKDGISTQIGGRNECFKMRNGVTDQKAKAFKLMFDTIDKILIQSKMPIVEETGTNVKHFGFEPYDSSFFDYFYEIRTNKEKRNEFYHYCVENVTSACSKKAFGEDSPWCHLYPNAHAPSDHPPISLAFNY